MMAVSTLAVLVVATGHERLMVSMMKETNGFKDEGG